MLALLRRLRSPGLVAILAILAGPAASAACLHAMADAAHADMMPMGEAPISHTSGGPMSHDGSAPAPCHEEPPAPEPASPSDGHGLHDCASPCCLAEAPAPEAPSLVVLSAQMVPAPLAAAVNVEDEPVVPTEIPEASPPPRPTRLHAVFQRFLI